MTREESKRRLLNIERCTPIHTREDVRDFEALEMAIQALEQEPCEDVISRQAAIDAIRRIGMCKCSTNEIEAIDECRRAVEAIPPATAEPKTGHWITDAKTYYEELKKRGLGVDEYTPYFTDDIACSECLAKYSMLDNETQFFKHCPNCGCRMVEPQESEE